MTCNFSILYFRAAKLPQKHQAVFSENPQFSELEIYFCVNVL